MNKEIYSDYSLMEWNAENSVEAPELDSQHKELTDFYNDAVNHCSGGETEEREYFDKTINPFIVLLEKHFKTEEQFLFGSGYSLYDAHKLDHEKTLEKINFIKKEIENNRWEMKLFILAITLKDTLMYHFTNYDIGAKEYFGEGIHDKEASGENYFAFRG